MTSLIHMATKQHDVSAYAFRCEDSVSSAYAPYAQARALSAGWQAMEVLNLTTRRYTDDVLEHEVDLTIAGCAEAPVVTVRVHSRVDAWTDALILDAQRVIARTPADAPMPTDCDEAISEDARKVIESHPVLVAMIDRARSRKVA